MIAEPVTEGQLSGEILDHNSVESNKTDEGSKVRAPRRPDELKVKSIVQVSELLENKDCFSKKEEGGKKGSVKQYYIIIKYFVNGDSKCKLHTKKIKFGDPTQGDDFVYHHDESRRYKFNLRSRSDHQPINSKFWKIAVLNGPSKNIRANFIYALTQLKNVYGRFEKPAFEEKDLEDLLISNQKSFYDW